MTLARRCPAAVLIGLLLTLMPPPAPAVAASEAAADYRRDARHATNNVRDRHDLKRLKANECLHRYAARHSREMAAQQRIWHQNLGRVLRECRMSFVGENVAEGFSSGRAVVRAWMDSPDHRRNILEPRFRKMEVAARKGGDGRWYATQLFGRR